MDGKLLLLDEDVPREKGENQNEWLIHACKLDITWFDSFYTCIFPVVA